MGLLQAIKADPENDALRLILADWLEEHGDPRGEFLRLDVELNGRLLHDPAWPDLERRRRELEALTQEVDAALNRDDYRAAVEKAAGLVATDAEKRFECVAGRNRARREEGHVRRRVDDERPQPYRWPRPKPEKENRPQREPGRRPDGRHLIRDEGGAKTDFGGEDVKRCERQ